MHAADFLQEPVRVLQHTSFKRLQKKQPAFNDWQPGERTRYILTVAVRARLKPLPGKY